MNHYSLSDSDMLGINEAIDAAENGNDITYAAIVTTWNRILAQEGLSWNDYTPENPLPTTEFAIPRDQSAEIMERMKKRAFALGISEIGVTNIMMDYMNYGPSFYENDQN